MEASGKTAAEFFSQIKVQALALVGIFTGGLGLEAVIRNTTNRLAELGDQARDIGRSVPELDAFRMAIGRNGGSADAAGQSLLRLTDTMERFKVLGAAGVQGQIGYFGQMGVQAGDSPLVVVQKYFDFVKAHADDPAIARIYGQGIGLDPGTINAANRISTRGGSLNEELALSRQIGLSTEAMTKHAQELQTAVATLEQTFTRLANVFVDYISPSLKAIVDKLTKELNPETATRFPGATPEDRQANLRRDMDARVTGAASGSSEEGRVIKYLFGGSNEPGWLGRLIADRTQEGWQAGSVAQKQILDNLLGLAKEPGWLGKRILDTVKSWFPQEEGWLGRAFLEQLPRWLNNMLGIKSVGSSDMAIQTDTGLRVPGDAGPAGPARTDNRGGPRVPRAGGGMDIQPITDPTLSPGKLGLLSALSGGERGGADPYHQRNFAGSSAYGMFQFMPSTWSEVGSKTGLTDIQNPSHQNNNAWALAAAEYKRYTFGRDLEADYLAGGHETDIANALKGRWPSLPGGKQQNTSPAQWMQRLNRGRSSTPNGVPRPGPIFGPQTPKPVVSDSALDSHVLLRPDQLDPALLPGPRARVPAAGSGVNDNSTSMQIDNLNVHTMATDSKGIARDIHRDLADEMIVQSNRGLQ